MLQKVFLNTILQLKSDFLMWFFTQKVPFFTLFTICFLFFRNIYIIRNKKETRKTAMKPIKSIVLDIVSSFSILFIDICKQVEVSNCVNNR